MQDDSQEHSSKPEQAMPSEAHEPCFASASPSRPPHSGLSRRDIDRMLGRHLIEAERQELQRRSSR